MSQDCTDEAGKVKSSNPFIEEPAQSNTVVDMKGERYDDDNVQGDRENSSLIKLQCSLLLYPLSLDVMVLNDIIEQAAGRHSRASDHGGKKRR